MLAVKSPIKAVVSLAEIVGGVVGAIFCALGYCFSGSESILKSLNNCGLHITYGIGGLLYSTINMLSLGIIGLIGEASKDNRGGLSNFFVFLLIAPWFVLAG